MRNLIAYLITAIALLTTSCNSNKDIAPNSIINPGQVIIEGQIEKYKGGVKTGKITHFDAVYRSGEDEVFKIDSFGKFKLSFELLMPTHTNFVKIGNNFAFLYLVPGNSYILSLKESGEFLLGGEMAFLHDQFIKSKVALLRKCGDLDNKRNRIVKSDSISYRDYCQFLKISSEQKIEFLKSYFDTVEVESSIQSIFFEDAFFEPAWARMSYRIKPTEDGRIIFRDSLPNSYFTNILSEFPINNYNTASSRSYMDYLSNVVDMISEYLIKDPEKFSIYLSTNSNLSKEEIDLTVSAASGDTSKMYSDDYRKLVSNNRSEMMDLFDGYALFAFFNNIESFETGSGRDLLISQFVTNYSFSRSYKPLDSETWELIERLISNKELFDYLFGLNKIYLSKQTRTKNLDANIIEPLLAKDSKDFHNQLFSKYSGKYVYVDFWATWCGPCRREMPVSKILHEKYKGKNIVFLYLCCASDRTSWENTIKSEQLTGEHYFLNADEENYLSSFFSINGYPTYVVVGPDGKLIDNNPPRPSSQGIGNYLNELIQ